jgi:hypothetical protein
MRGVGRTGSFHLQGAMGRLRGLVTFTARAVL